MKKKKIFLGIGIVLLAILTYFQVISNNVITLNNEVFINASPDKVWSILNNLEEVENYNPQVSKAVCISTEHSGVNASRQCTMKDGSVIKERVSLVEPYQAITMELYESSWPVQNMKWRTAITAKNSGTLVTQKLQYQVKYGAFGALLNSVMMKNKMYKSLEEVFTELKNYSETK